jgi:hypothetical protein
MLLRTPVLSASFTAILAIYVVATPMGPPLRSTDEAMSLEYHAPSYPSPPSLPHPPPKPHMPKAYPEKKLKLNGLSYSPSSSNPSQEKYKSEERPYVSPPSLPLLPSLSSKEEKPKAHEKDYPSAPPKKSYPEKPKTEGKPYLPLPPPLFSPTPPPSKASTENPKIEKKPEEKSDAVTASSKGDKPKPSDKPKSNEKPHSPPPSPQKPHSQEDKQKIQAPKTDDTKVGCTAGKCRRVDPVTCDIPLFRSSDSDSIPSDFRVAWAG